jgi:diguanylate cyclase (GGDEF)-like protein
MQGRLRLTSPGALLILAVCLTGAILLLDSYLFKPYVESQRDAALHDQAHRVEQSASGILAAQTLHLSNIANLTDSQNATIGDAQLAQMATPLFENSKISFAWTCDSTGIVAAWGAQGLNDALRAELASAAAEARRDSGLMRINKSIIVFSRHCTSGSSGRHLYLATTLSNDMLASMGRSAGAQVTVVNADSLPPKVLQDASTARAVWPSGDDRLSVAWLASDTSGKTLGYFRADLPASQIYAQAAAARRIVLIILSLSVGLVLLVIMGTHMLIAGPVVRLLRRLQQLDSGETSSEPLTHDLHGEPLVIARRLQSAFERLAHMSKTDQLTSLANRRHFSEVLDCFYHQSRRYNRPMSVIMLDMDYFKAINDSAGHQAGDEALKFLAGCIEKACRKADLPARFGGDEFAILLPETFSADAMQVAKRILQNVSSQPFSSGNLKFNLTVSIGIADLNAGMIDSPEGMLSLADQALYAAKEAGRNRAVLANDMHGGASPNDGRKVEVLCRKLAGLDTQFKDLFLQAVEEVVEVLEQRDPNMADHARKVQRYAGLIANEMGLPQRVVKRIEVAAMLHDIGMLAMPDSLLLCPGPLDAEQIKNMRRHPLLSVRIMEGMEFLEHEIPAVRYHHERYDGKGYPEGLSGPKIPLTARILAVADVFDAITSDRVFRRAMSRDQAIDEIVRMAGSQFDPEVVDSFVAVCNKAGDKLMEQPKREPHARWRTQESDDEQPAAASPGGDCDATS